MKLRYSIRENMAPGDTLEAKFRALADIGIEGIEIVAGSTLENVGVIKKASKETGVVPNVVSTRGGMGLLDARADERLKAVEAIRTALTICRDVGGVGVIYPPLIGIKMGGGQRIPDLSPRASTPQLERDLLVDILGESVAPHAEACGCSLIIEPLNRYEQWWPCRVDQGVEVCEAVGSPGVTTMADLFHMNIEEADLAEAIRAGGKHLANVHLADSNRLLPGHGHTDFGPPLKALVALDYPHYCGFECGYPPGVDRAEALATAIDYLESQI